MWDIRGGELFILNLQIQNNNVDRVFYEAADEHHTNPVCSSAAIIAAWVLMPAYRTNTHPHANPHRAGVNVSSHTYLREIKVHHLLQKAFTLMKVIAMRVAAWLQIMHNSAQREPTGRDSRPSLQGGHTCTYAYVCV